MIQEGVEKTGDREGAADNCTGVGQQVTDRFDGLRVLDHERAQLVAEEDAGHSGLAGEEGHALGMLGDGKLIGLQDRAVQPHERRRNYLDVIIKHHGSWKNGKKTFSVVS